MTDPTMRTPSARFERLLDFPFEANFIDVGGLSMHYVDERPSDADVVLMLHGEPTWSYLYRHMIPICSAAGHRVIAPDLIGFGKSDKPKCISDYSYQAHMDWLGALIEGLDLKGITLVCQDWGSLLGLRYAAENPERFRAIVVGNGMLPTGDQAMPSAFRIWKNFALYTPVFPTSRIVDFGSFRKLSADERRAYEAPFPSRHYMAGARAFPALVPATPDDPATEANRAAWEALSRWEKPFVTAFSNGDPITRGGDRYMQERIPGAQGQPHTTLKGGHFLQEDSPVPFARLINQVIADLHIDDSAVAK